MTIKKTIYDVIIIGSGIAGLSAARAIHQKGHAVLVLDKGRRIGGRCATKRVDGFTFNHGAQFFTTKDESFTNIAKQASAQEAVTSWSFGHDRACYIGAPTMRDFPQMLADGLRVRQSVKITTIEKQDGLYRLIDDEAEDYYAHRLILTPPAPQSAALLETLSPLLANTAKMAHYDPCWTVMVGLHSPCDGRALPLRDKAPIGWASAEDSRQPQMRPAVTIQADPHTSLSLIDHDKDEVTPLLIEAFETATNQKLDIAMSAAHRWLYARVRQPAPADAAFIDHDNHLAIAGDWFGKARLETAFLAGQRAASALLQNS